MPTWMQRKRLLSCSSPQPETSGDAAKRVGLPAEQEEHTRQAEARHFWTRVVTPCRFYPTAASSIVSVRSGQLLLTRTRFAAPPDSTRSGP